MNKSLFLNPHRSDFSLMARQIIGSDDISQLNEKFKSEKNVQLDAMHILDTNKRFNEPSVHHRCVREFVLFW